MKSLIVSFALLVSATACMQDGGAAMKDPRPQSSRGLYLTPGTKADPSRKTELAAFSAGCFWGVEDAFRKLDGVVATAAGYCGGHTKKPDYHAVSEGNTGHAETVQVEFNPKVISYESLLDTFWNIHDPTTPNRQGPDVGEQYRSAIFFYSDAQKKAALASRDKLQRSGELDATIVTEIAPAGDFWKAEGYHQQYVEKGGAASCHYRKKKAALPLAPALTEMQKHVTRENGTEPPFQNEYWNNHRDGIYVDINSGEALFSSKDKFDSGTGWPSFTRPLKKDNVVTKEDKSLWATRTEVRSKSGDSHLGHVFPDGPGQDGTRFCINSASLRFVPAEDLAREGYGEFESQFKKGAEKR